MTAIHKQSAAMAILALFVALAFGACSQHHDAEWYSKHPDAAQKRVLECQKLTMEGKLDPLGDSAQADDCRNAAQAIAMQVIQGFGS